MAVSLPGRYAACANKREIAWLAQRSGAQPLENTVLALDGLPGERARNRCEIVGIAMCTSLVTPEARTSHPG